MDRRCFLAGPLLALLLLCSCQGAGGDGPSSGSPAPSGPDVQVHWDVLEGSESVSSTARRLSEGWMDDLVPGSYGQIIPYIGSEQSVRYDYEDVGSPVRYETQYLYGLCTTDGLLLTDPVYTSVRPLTWFDRETGESRTLPVWAVYRTLPDPDSYYGYASCVGLAAADGSWYTGLKFRGPEFSLLSANSRSVLLQEGDESAVLLSLADGSELARYTPYDFLPAGTGPDDARWFFSSLSWGAVWCLEDSFYFNLSDAGYGDGPVWMDAVTGAIDRDPDRPAPVYSYTGRIPFGGGWYEDPPPEGPLVLHYDDGTQEVLPYDAATYGDLANASREHLLFLRYHDEGSSDYTLTDHGGNVLLRLSDSSIWLGADELTGEQYPVIMETVDPDTYVYRYTLLDSGGAPLVSTLAYPTVYSGLLAVAEERCYRLLDLGDGGREVFRLPRWAALDGGGDPDPAEDGARYFFAEGGFLGAWDGKNWHSASAGGFTLGQLFERDYVDVFGSRPGAVRFYVGEGPGSFEDPQQVRQLLAPYGIVEGSEFVMKLPGRLGGGAAEVAVPTGGFYAAFDGQTYQLISNEPLTVPILTPTGLFLDNGAVDAILRDWGISCPLERTVRTAWEADLDGDGQTEHLELLQTPQDGESGWLTPEVGDSIFYLLLLADGEETTVVTGWCISYTTDPTAWAIPGEPIVADLDGDGVCELILRHGCWEWGHYSAFTREDGWWREVLRADYGV